MNPIAIFYHSLFSSRSRPIDTGYACCIMQEQMEALKNSGLLSQAQSLTIGVNGGSEDVSIARLLAPMKAVIVPHGEGATTEIPTLNLLRAFAASHPDWFILYHHMKGVSNVGEPINHWRRRMERGVIWRWSECVFLLSNGFDACGSHWLTPQQYPGMVDSPFFGGTFWWATARYLNRLPELPAPTWDNRYHAERWIGLRNPRVRDFHPGWP